jgi:PPM family protein phosphatase
VTLRFGALSDVGRRRARNEDAWLALPDRGVFAVADGMGGHAGGRVASRLAVAAVRAALDADGRDAVAADELAAAFAAAGASLAEAARATPAYAEMGTTLAAVALAADGSGCTVAHVGDSRVYRLRGRALELLTHDHTWVQQQVDAGLLTPSQARRHPRAPLLLRVLDARGGGAPDIAQIDLEPEDTLLLCTDGLSGPVFDEDIAAILARPLPPETLARDLIDAANARGGPDNITAVVIQPTG